MSAPHIDDDVLDRYASESLRPELLAATEEHLLTCSDCQTRLIAVDEFIGLFRAAATQTDARPQPLRQRLFHARWIGAAAVVAAVFSLVFIELPKPSIIPATVFMHSLRGPEAVVPITAGKPVGLSSISRGWRYTGLRSPDRESARNPGSGEPCGIRPWTGERSAPKAGRRVLLGSHLPKRKQ